ncbi:MAG TPA: hypothetical protein VF733_04520 [Candidatus Saccharimonadales bacterium]
MHALSVVFGLRAIYLKQTWMQIFVVYGILGLCLGWFGSTYLGDFLAGIWVFWLLLAIYSWALIRTTVRTLLADNILRKYGEANFLLASELGVSSTRLEINAKNSAYPIASQGKTQICLSTFTFYVRTRLGSYLSKQILYTVLVIPLTRQLPHILFDSKRAKGKQFRSVYLKSQKIHVQGTFDLLFDTYVPKYYAVDSLSFVSPEVAEVLIQAQEYDLEIINDKLLIYAPLLDEDGIATLKKKGKLIATAFNDNIDNYRDDRLTGEERRTTVTPFARSLLRSPRKYVISAITSGLVSTCFIVGSFLAAPEDRKDILLNDLSIIAYTLFLFNSVTVYQIIHENGKRLESYRSSLRPPVRRKNHIYRRELRF